MSNRERISDRKVKRVQKDVVSEISDISGINKVICGKVYAATIEVFKQRLLNGIPLTLYGFCTMKPVVRAARRKFDINTGKVAMCGETNSVAFKLSEDFKKELNDEEE